MSHLEQLIAEFLDWQGYLVRRNTQVGRLRRGGWEMELDVVAYHPQTSALVHYEPSIDAVSWKTRELRYAKKFEAGRRYILTQIFPWLPSSTALQQIAVFITHPRGRDKIAGGDIISIDEFMAEVRRKVFACGVMANHAVPEQYPLLRTIQLSHAGYYRVIQ